MGGLVVGRSVQAAAGEIEKHLRFPLDNQYRIFGRLPKPLQQEDFATTLPMLLMSALSHTAAGVSRWRFFVRG